MPFIWQISKLNFKKRTIIRGVILDENFPNKKDIHTKSTFSRVINSYHKKPYSNKEIVVVIQNIKYPLLTNETGGFSLEIESLGNSFEVYPKDLSQPFKLFQSYPVIFNDSDFPLNIISDIDDTILVSYTSSLWKRMSTLLFVSPNKRKSISFTQNILHKIQTKKGGVFYVSKSESNLFAILSTFIKKNNLPQGNLMLTPYIRFRQLLGSKKGRDFKEQMIRMILDWSPDKKFILMGDDTQQDIIVYSKIVQLYPNQIFKIYIRKTKKNLRIDKKEQLEKLMCFTVPVLYFSDGDNVSSEIEAIENYQN